MNSLSPAASMDGQLGAEITSLQDSAHFLPFTFYPHYWKKTVNRRYLNILVYKIRDLKVTFPKSNHYFP